MYSVNINGKFRLCVECLSDYLQRNTDRLSSDLASFSLFWPLGTRFAICALVPPLRRALLFPLSVSGLFSWRSISRRSEVQSKPSLSASQLKIVKYPPSNIFPYQGCGIQVPYRNVPGYCGMGSGTPMTATLGPPQGFCKGTWALQHWVHGTAFVTPSSEWSFQAVATGALSGLPCAPYCFSGPYWSACNFFLISVHGFQSSFSLCPKLLAFCSTALNTKWILCWLSPGLFTLHPDKCWLWQHPGFKVRIYIHSPPHGHIFSKPQIFSSASLCQPTQN